MTKKTFRIPVCMVIAALLALCAWPVYAGQGSTKKPEYSHRLIVELASPPLARWSTDMGISRHRNGRLNVMSAEARDYITRLRTEQSAFIRCLKTALPAASVSTYENEHGDRVKHTYHVVFNGMTIEPGTNNTDGARRSLRGLPGVKAVYRDRAHYQTMYASLPLINAPSAWNNPAVGGGENAGAGIKVASLDGGIHKDAPMFDGTGFSYPFGFPEGGLGLTANNNGKIIASRAYFRSGDPPAPGDENPWPGENGISHGVHTAGTAAGNPVDADYLGVPVPLSGVAPGAWVMSYRVFYPGVSGIGAFYTAEGIAALEDIVQDGADVVNNSWGAGPVSVGGENDPGDQALINTARAGVFVSMAAGNEGPGKGTTDHPSGEYITVGACTTGGSFAAGMIHITAPGPVSETLRDIPLGTAEFGPGLPYGETVSYPLVTARSVDLQNSEGCSPWPDGSFDGKAVLISRGSCSFADKAYYAQQAGATLAVIYNNDGDGTMDMGCGGEYCDEGLITIASVFIGQSHGEEISGWYETHGDETAMELDMVARQVGNTPDVIASFSNRGPGVGGILVPDIAAPGVGILSQGYAPGTEGEDRHLGYGQAQGTSMAAPHVAGAAALIRQIHPGWSNDYIKSALMTTAKYLDVYNHDNSTAQPLDMGAGRLDLTSAADPGIVLDPPSLSFGFMKQGTGKSLNVTVTSVANTAETYDISTLYTGSGFDNTGELEGFSVTPSSISLAPGESAVISVTFDSQQVPGTGDKQGFIIMQGTGGHHAHMPAWARVQPSTSEKILIIDNDLSTLTGGSLPDYADFYTGALDELGLSYELWDADLHADNDTTIPDAATLSAYRAIIYYTGDNFYPDGSFAVSTPLTLLDMDRLTEYANGGGSIIAMGQDMAYILEDSFLYADILGGSWLRDSVTGSTDNETFLPELPVIPVMDSPPAFADIYLDLGRKGDGAGNQGWIDEIEDNKVPLLRYPGADNIEDGVVAIANRDQPNLELPGLTYLGRSIYATFGLEGVNSDRGTTTRAELLETFLNWAADEPQVTISDETPENQSNLTILGADLTSNIPGTTAVAYRWDFGDGTDYSYSHDNMSSHVYETCGTYTVRVQARDTWGNIAIGSREIDITHCTNPEDIRCFIATAAFGSPLEPHVAVLRNFRDRFLMGNPVGEKAVELYYTLSPPAARCIAEHEALRSAVRWCLLPVAGMCSVLLQFGTVPALVILCLLAFVPAMVIRLKSNQPGPKSPAFDYGRRPKAKVPR